jgi:hypothetical protein
MRHSSILAVFAGILTCAIAQAGDVYKIIDDHGNTVYTDKPLPGAVLVSTGTPHPPEAAARSYAEQQANTTRQLNASNQHISDQQTDARAAATVAKDLEATRLERCKKARAEYQQTINSRRLYREEAGGKRNYLSDAELASARIDAQKQVDAICGPQG